MATSNPGATADAGKSKVKEYGFLSIVVIAMLGALQGVDPGLTNIAMSKVSKALELTDSQVALGAAVGTLSLAASVIAVGALADRIGVRKVIMLGLVLGIVGDLTVAFAHGATVFMLGRIIAGVGMGALFAGAFSMVPHIAGTKSMSSVIGKWTGMVYLIVIVLTVVGSQLIQANWRYGFFLIPLMCLLMIPAVRFTLPETPKVAGDKKFDVLGLTMLALGMIFLLLGISNAASKPLSAFTIGGVVLGIVFLGLFALVEAKSDHPAFPIELFKMPLFVGAVIAGLVWNFTAASMQLQFANIWQEVLKMPAGNVGFSELPYSLSAAACGFLVGGLLAKGRSPVVVMIIGVAMSVVGFLSVSFVSADEKYLSFLPALLLIGGGIVFIGTAQAREYVRAAPAKFLSAVVSSRTAVGQLGYAIGIAMSTTVLSIALRKDDGTLSSDPDDYATAFNTTMLFSAGVVLVFGLLAAVLLGRGLRSKPEHKGTSALEMEAEAQPR